MLQNYRSEISPRPTSTRTSEPTLLTSSREIALSQRLIQKLGVINAHLGWGEHSGAKSNISGALAIEVSSQLPRNDQLKLSL